MSVTNIEDPHRLADTIASQLLVSFQEKQRLLEILPVDKRLEAILGLLYREGEILNLEKSIQQRVRKQMEKAQREYYLREQIKAIQVELGERDEKGKSETEELKEKLQKGKLPKEAKAKVLHEIHVWSAWRPCPQKQPLSGIISIDAVSAPGRSGPRIA